MASDILEGFPFTAALRKNYLPRIMVRKPLFKTRLPAAYD